MTKAEVRAICKQDPQKWETVLRDCLDEMDYDDIESVFKKLNIKLPLDSYLYHCDLIYGHVIEMCQANPKLWKKVGKGVLAFIPGHFIEYLSEECNW